MSNESSLKYPIDFFNIIGRSFIASKDFVDGASLLRGIVDRQGDALLELTFANLLSWEIWIDTFAR